MACWQGLAVPTTYPHCTAVLLTFTQSVCIYEYTYLRDLDLPVVQRAHETCTQSDLD